MAFIRKVKPKRTCKDFKRSFWTWDICRLTYICEDAINHLSKYGFCTGVKCPELESPKGLQSGVR